MGFRGDEGLMAFGGIKAHAQNLHVVVLHVANMTRKEQASSAVPGVASSIKIKQHQLFADEFGKIPRLAVLILAGDQRALSPAAGFAVGGQSGRLRPAKRPNARVSKNEEI